MTDNDDRDDELDDDDCDDDYDNDDRNSLSDKAFTDNYGTSEWWLLLDPSGELSNRMNSTAVALCMCRVLHTLGHD